MLKALGALYVQGHTLDWSVLYPGESRCVQLPTYPWQRERLWLDWLDNPKVNRGSEHERVSQKSDEPVGHSLLGRHTELAHPAGTHVWEVAFDKQTLLPYLADHQIQEGMILPDIVYREVVLTAAAEALRTDGPYILEDMVIHEAFMFHEKDSRIVQLILTIEEAKQASFQIFSLRKIKQDERPSWILHAAGQVGLGQVNYEVQLAEQPSGGQSELLRHLEAAPPGQRWDLLLAHVRDQVLKVLGLESSHSLSPRQGLFEAGLNSLAAVELMNHLQASIGQPLPTTLVFEYPTIKSLSEYLAQEIRFVGSVAIPNAKSQTDNGGQETLALEELEQFSEEEAEALLIKKLETIERKLG
jgi:acyl transferase domain-containing protein